MNGLRHRFWMVAGALALLIASGAATGTPVAASKPHHHHHAVASKPKHHKHHVPSAGNGAGSNNAGAYQAVGCYPGDNICYIAATGHMLK